MLKSDSQLRTMNNLVFLSKFLFILDYKLIHGFWRVPTYVNMLLKSNVGETDKLPSDKLSMIS